MNFQRSSQFLKPLHDLDDGNNEEHWRVAHDLKTNPEIKFKLKCCDSN